MGYKEIATIGEVRAALRQMASPKEPALSMGCEVRWRQKHGRRQEFGILLDANAPLHPRCLLFHKAFKAAFDGRYVDRDPPGEPLNEGEPLRGRWQLMLGHENLSQITSSLSQHYENSLTRPS